MKKGNEKLSLKYLTALIVADVDIFLLKNEEQTADNEKEYFTREEIRSQLKDTMQKTCKVLTDCGFDINAKLLIKTPEWIPS